jgi:hypothetical protein
VVSSDREVIAAAEDRGARVVRSEAFVDQMEGAPASEGDKESEVHLGPEEVDAWLELFGEEGF